MSQMNSSTVTLREKQKGQMGAYAPFYDCIMFFLTLGKEKRLRQMTLDLAQLKPGDKVLEIGSGTGTLTLAAKDRVGSSGEVQGIDVAPEMVAVATRKAARKKLDAKFQAASIAAIPFPDNRFDLVMCSFMIFHMPDDVRRKGLTEIYRVLKPGGRLFIIDTVDLNELSPVLKESSFKEVRNSSVKFSYMKLSLIQAIAHKL